jgi:uncharacterized protein YndB with AHSA1/START domain
MQTVHIERDFSIPVEKLYDYLSEHENLGAIFGMRVEHIQDGAETRSGAGSVRRLSLAGVAPFEETVTLAEPNERIEYRITKGSPLRDHEGRMVFSSTPAGGSHLDYTIEFGAAIPGVDALVAAVLRRRIPAGLAKIESELATSA